MKTDLELSSRMSLSEIDLVYMMQFDVVTGEHEFTFLLQSAETPAKHQYARLSLIRAPRSIPTTTQFVASCGGVLG